MATRKKPDNEKPKVPVGLSFAGKDGYKALEVLNDNQAQYGKSGLVIELLNVFSKAQECLGEDDTIFKLKMLLENTKKKK